MESDPTDKPVPALSRREREVLEILARGQTDKEAAQALGVSLGSVRVYRKRLQAKLGTDCLVQSLLVAGGLGMVDLKALVEEALEAAVHRRGILRRTGPSAT